MMIMFLYIFTKVIFLRIVKGFYIIKVRAQTTYLNNNTIFFLKQQLAVSYYLLAYLMQPSCAL